MGKKVKFDFRPSDYVKGIRFKSKAQRNRVMRDISDFVTESVLEDVGSSKSPVTGRGFKRLDGDYGKKKRKEVGNASANLELQGSMLDSLRVTRKDTKMRLEVSSSQNDKADGHNNHSGKSKLPRRPFIPNKESGEDFRPAIREGIARIIKRSKDE
jgi:hypothetical protein